MKLSKLFLEEISTDKVRLPLCVELGVSYDTLKRWMYYDNEKFATLKVIAAINKVTGLTQDEIFEFEETEK